MSDKLYFTPVIGYRLTRHGVLPADDNWNNRWQGGTIACANHDRSVPWLRQEPSPLTVAERGLINRTFHPLFTPELLPELPANAVRYMTTGTFDLGSLESPLKTICDARRRAAQDAPSRE